MTGTGLRPLASLLRQECLSFILAVLVGVCQNVCVEQKRVTENRIEQCLHGKIL